MGQYHQTLDPLYDWVSSTEEYINFDRGASRMLLISGSPGTGTTELMLAIVQGISQQVNKGFVVNLVSFVFCSNGNHKPENAASVMKILLYQILELQPKLSMYLKSQRRSTGRKDFSDANDLYALSLMMYSIIQDKQFEPIIIVVDEFDQSVLDGFDNFLNMIITTMRLSNRVQ
jgi:hypothetical protein